MNKLRTYPLRPISVSLFLLFCLRTQFVRLQTIIGQPASMPFPAVVRADSTALQTPRTMSTARDLWVDAAHGHDQNHGLAQSSALRSIQQAANLAGPGTTVHILPGVYRESIRPAQSGTTAEPIRYVAEGGPGTAAVRGSEPSSSLPWTQLSSNSIGLPAGTDPRKVYYADLSSWGLTEAPRFIAYLGSSGTGRNPAGVRRLPMAREPDWQVVQEWKYSAYWWAADGGNSVPGCDPSAPGADNCDRSTWSTTQLIDRTSDNEPAGIQAGNLTTLGNLTGATLMVLDTRQAHWMFRRTIASHNVAAGQITVDEPCTYGSTGTALGWASKYYVEGLPSLLDTPGEWWYDASSKRLYLWPPENGSPADQGIEISRRDTGFDWTGRSNQTLDGLTVEFYNEHGVYQANNYRRQSRNNTIRNSTLCYANWGLWITQSTHADWPTSVTDGFKLLNSEISYMDSRAMTISSWWPPDGSADSFSHPGVTNTTIRGNHLHHLGFRSDEEHGHGIELRYPDTLRFEGNHVHHTAHHGVQFLKSVIQSPQEHDFAPDEIKIGEILVSDNLFEQACQLTTECAAVKIWGDDPDRHVYRDLLVIGNIFRNTYGWTYVAEKRHLWGGDTSSEAGGMGGMGLDVDGASGIHLYRNIAYNNAHAGFRFAGTWRDGDIVCYNNVLANSLYGVRFAGSNYDTHPSVNTRLVNNILANNEGYGILLGVQDDIDRTMIVDHNLYYNNGWRSRQDGGHYDPGAMAILRKTSGNSYYPTLSIIRDRTPWESHGVEGNPRFMAYDVNDHNLHDGSWPSFLLTSNSTRALDRGDDLPASLRTLLATFAVGDAPWGSAYDIGRYEWSDNIESIYLPIVLKR